MDEIKRLKLYSKNKNLLITKINLNLPASAFNRFNRNFD